MGIYDPNSETRRAMDCLGAGVYLDDIIVRCDGYHRCRSGTGPGTIVEFYINPRDEEPVPALLLRHGWDNIADRWYCPACVEKHGPGRIQR
jgi:hypothetical protein